MINYNFIFTNVPGESYHRVCEMNVSNPRRAVPNVTYQIEELTNRVDGGFVTEFIGSVFVKVASTDEEKATVIPLFDDTGKQHGEMSRGEILNMMKLFSNSELLHEVHKQKLKEIEKPKELSDEVKTMLGLVD